MYNTTDNSLVVVTGASGYIGGQTVLEFSDAGYNVIGIDIKTPSKNILSSLYKFLSCDFTTDRSIEEISKNNPIAIIHCAGSSLVEPSLENPELYYRNNFIKTKKFIDSLLETHFSGKFIFSSSAAVYGNPEKTPIAESHPCSPISPYGQSKLMTEMLLESYHQAYNLNYIAFRYFNACGSDISGRHGQPSDATHIIAKVVESLKNNRQFTLYGNDYNTPDGTCIRDYIHVCDIAHAHRLAVEKNINCGPYNLGSGNKTSNIDVITTAQNITNKKLNWKYADRRIGDPDCLVTNSDDFKNITGWKPRWDLKDIIKHVWAWQNNCVDKVA